MSSIIDALKKSDKNRKGDHQADINNIQFSDNPTPKSRQGFWLLVIVLLLVATGVFAWQQGWHHKLLSYFEQEPQATSAETLNEKNQEANQTIEVIEPQKASKDKHVLQPTGNQLIPPKQSEIKAKTEQIRKDKMKQTIVGEEIKPALNQHESIKPLKKRHAENNQPKVAQQNTQSNDKGIDTIKNNDPVTEGSKVDKSGHEKTSLEPTLKQDYLLLHQIDFSIRKNIPAVKLNIHIYDPEPENRMVLINGERYNIGDSIENVLTVTNIVKEGIVVTFENVEFLIPK